MKLNVRNRFILMADLLLITLSILLSYFLRLEYFPDFTTLYLSSALWLLGISIIVKPLTFYFLGLYRRIWIYASINELKLIAIAVSVSTLIVSALYIGFYWLGLFGPGFSRSVLAIDWLLSLILIGGSRLIYRLLAETNSTHPDEKAKRVLVVGAGDAGSIMVREMQKNSQINLQPIGFLDDDPLKQNRTLHDLPIFGPVKDLGKVVEKNLVDEVIIAIPSAPGRMVRQVAELCRPLGIPFRTMPGIYELLGGKVNVSRLREVQITDLLRREPARIHEEWIGETIRGKIVLITGAGGSIGSELCRQTARWEPKELVMLGHGENSIFEVYMELKENFPALNISPVIADVRDLNRIREVFGHHQPQVVFHTAAHKHVFLMQLNVNDAITNNVFGTQNIVDAAVEFGVERFVLITTDKAVNPANVYGATKRLAEMVVLEKANTTKKAFSVVRFGNVLGSRGSVVPIFKRQIAAGGPISITHPDMERFFMTIPEAVHLVLQAASMGKGGEAFLLNMGEQIRILDLAEDLIKLSGLQPGKDIEIIFTGIKSGEKLREELWEKDKNYEKTAHPDIFRSQNESGLEGLTLAELISELESLVEEDQPQKIVTLLDEVIPNCSITKNIEHQNLIDEI